MQFKNFTQIEEISRKYRAGVSLHQLSMDYGSTSRTIKGALVRHGTPMRTKAEAIRLSISQSDTRIRFGQHRLGRPSALKGRPRSQTTLAKRAQTIEQNGTYISKDELKVADWLLDLGVKTTAQKAYGPYNVDLATDRVVIEIFGGNWHATGAHKERAGTRFRHLLNEGLNVVVIWVDRSKHPLSAEAAEYIADYIEYSASSPTERGRFRSIRGNGSEAFQGGIDDVHLLEINPSNAD